MAICEHTPPPCPPSGGALDNAVWATEVDRRRNTIGLLVSYGRHDGARLSTSVWLQPDDAEKIGHAMLAAVAAWRGQ